MGLVIAPTYPISGVIIYSIKNRPAGAIKPVSPRTFISDIEIAGQVTRDMYDEHPGLAYFCVDEAHCVSVPPFCSLERAIDIGIRSFASLKAVSDVEGDEEDYDGRFAPEHVVLYDEARRVVFQFDGTRESADEQMAAPLPPEAEHADLLEAARALDREAAFEGGLDNFSTAERLRNQSRAIRDRVSRARHLSAVVKTEPLRGLEVRAAYGLTAALMRSDEAIHLTLRKKLGTIVRKAHRLGYYETLSGVSESPVMFGDCPDLNEAWIVGSKECAEDIKNLMGCFSPDSLLLNMS